MTTLTLLWLSGLVLGAVVAAMLPRLRPRRLLVAAVLDGAKMPTPQRPGDAGLDLAAAHDFAIQPGETVRITTGCAVELPRGCVGLVCPRSGLALCGVTVANAPGVVDENYRGPADVILVNHGAEVYRGKAGDRVAQLVVLRVCDVAVEAVAALSADRRRGVVGFGSSGR